MTEQDQDGQALHEALTTIKDLTAELSMRLQIETAIGRATFAALVARGIIDTKTVALIEKSVAGIKGPAGSEERFKALVGENLGTLRDFVATLAPKTTA